jgi:Ala-tRNA(Pro) deacylase
MTMRILKEHLDGRRARYVSAHYSPACTAEEIARTPNLSGWSPVESHLVGLDGRLAIAVVPAGAEPDLAKLASATGSRNAEPASDEQVARRFPTCEVGAIPPVGALFDLPLYVEESLARADGITFFAGKRTEVISMRFREYFRIVEPKLVELARR